MMLRRRLLALVLTVFFAAPSFAQSGPAPKTPAAPDKSAAQAKSAAAPAAAKPFTVEYYYKVKWGSFDEFLRLYKKNHYPLLLDYMRMGRILSMSAAYPANHAGEADRWDFRFTIVWKDAATAHDDFDYAAHTKQHYPDQETFQREEKQRFEMLLEHMDVPVYTDDLKDWKAEPEKAK